MIDFLERIDDLEEKIDSMPSDELSDAMEALLIAANRVHEIDEEEAIKLLNTVEDYWRSYEETIDWETPVQTYLILRLDIGQFPLNMNRPEDYVSHLRQSVHDITDCEIIKVER
jgi:hypothetical protein